MKKYGIRIAEPRLSVTARAAEASERSILTDDRKSVAITAPPPAAVAGAKFLLEPIKETKPLSDAEAFRQALFGAPYPLELEF